jgi:D-apionolactonase
LAWFDEAGGLYPVFHVLRGLSRLAGGTLRKVSIDAPREVQALAVEKGGKSEIWIANLTGEPMKVRIGGISSAKAAFLDASNFIEAAMDAEHLDRLSATINSDAIELDAYAVMRLLI